MADRLSQYAMISNFAPGIIHQQQSGQPQQPQQQPQTQPPSNNQQPDSHQLSAFPDQGRMWQVQQMQNQFRQHGGVDIGVSPGNAQMNDLIRTQAMAQNQQQQQQQQQQLSMQQQQQRFPLSAQQMQHLQQNVAGPSQQSFVDMNSQGQQPPAGFPNLGMNNIHQRNMMMQTFSNPNHHRQLELINLAQNQNYGARLNPPQQVSNPMANQPAMNQSTPDIFSGMMSNDSLRRPSPSHPPMQQPGSIGNPAVMPQRQMSMAQPRRFTIADMTERANQLNHQLSQQANMVRQLQEQHQNSGNQELVPKLRAAMTDFKSKQEQLARIRTLINMSAGKGPNPMAGGAPQPPWMPPANPSFDSRQAPPTMQTQQVHGHPNHLMSLPNTNMPQPGQPPHQQGTHFSNQLPPNTGQQFPFQMNNPNSTQQPNLGHLATQPRHPIPQTQPQHSVGTIPGTSIPLPPPLEKQKFDIIWKNFCQGKNIKISPDLLQIDSRIIDLHSLHVQVMHEGGYQKVDREELWNVVGGRMGLVAFPGTETEPAKAGPAAAQRLSHIYRMYLLAFDQVYLQSVLDSKRKMAPAPPAQTQNQQGLISRFTPQQMQAVLSYAQQPVANLRSQGIPDKMIQFVESNRNYLQRLVQEQRLFQGGLRQGPTGPPTEAGNASNHPQGLFAGLGNQQDPNALRQQMHQPPHSSGGVPINGLGNLPWRPTKEQMAAAGHFVKQMKQEVLMTNIPNMMERQVDVPLEHRVEYINLIESLNKFGGSPDSELKLATYSIILKQEDILKRLVSIAVVAQRQRQLLSSGNPRYIVSLEQVRAMVQQVHQAMEMYNAIVQARPPAGNQGPPAPPVQQDQRLQQHQQQPMQHQAQPQPQPPHISPRPMPSAPPHMQAFPPAPPNQLPPNFVAPPNHGAGPVDRHMNLKQPPAAKKAVGNLNTPALPPAIANTPPLNPPPVSTPASAHPASTPTASPAPAAGTPGPSHAAPSPKSPKPKATPKQAKGQPKRKLSKPIPPGTLPDSSHSPGTKRPREEDSSSTPNASGSSGSSGPISEPSPPKRVKIEWEESVKKEEEAPEMVKTEEEATALIEQVAELLTAATPDAFELSTTLDQLLKGYGTGIDTSDVSDPNLGDGGFGIPGDEVFEFFDFSSCAPHEEDETASKAATPDLVSSSSTNPSPGSGSEAEGSQHPSTSSSFSSSSMIKNEDLLRLGPWKELDGGESIYYQQAEFKWDGPMLVQDQAWPMFTA
ncbi:hypothetical protein BDN72DRAFT_839158 [Pluteus cervinus]|uniref:Uncharacterized protein n=1 Tax=Pluteus cervinus TaxID=181527 RepID=A0ACD3AX63_9AGAR|nr:hypothetical protein BDN72DRAFT_839158 [Pluteus cervinus]